MISAGIKLLFFIDQKYKLKKRKKIVCSSRVSLQLLDEVQTWLPFIQYLVPEANGNHIQYWRDSTNKVCVTQFLGFLFTHPHVFPLTPSLSLSITQTRI